ncbi:MAG TPA: dihydropteroate synthase [Herpetosiphonaceae bacterium]
MATQFNVRVLAAAEASALATEIARIESYPERVAATTGKGIFRVVRVDQLSYVAAIIVKQELLALDADGVISPAVYLGDRAATTDMVIFATLRQYRSLVERLAAFPLDELHGLAAQLAATFTAYDATERGSLAVRGRAFRWGERTYIMGILNITPDSFAGDGLARDGDTDVVVRAVARAQHFAASGADLLDVGGESTRPGARQVDADEERARVLPVIAALRQALDLPISVDTWKAEVAAAALDAGADLVNDVWGLRLPGGGWNKALARLVSERQVPIIIMHNRRAQPTVVEIGHYRHVAYTDLLGEILRELRESIQFALDHGIQPEKIIVDPGPGFGKTPTHNIELLRRFSEFKSLGYPLLLATSRKSFIGLALGGVPPHERVEGTAATAALGIQAGADIVRVHDVASIARVARMTDAIIRPGAWQRLTTADAPATAGSAEQQDAQATSE